MACGCSRRGFKRTRTLRPPTGPGPSVKRGLAVAKTPTEARAIARDNSKNNIGIPGNVPTSSVQKRMLVEKKRRALIMKKLGK